jgi:hypothetical protein
MFNLNSTFTVSTNKNFGKSTSKLIVNGKAYSSMDDLPGHLRTLLEDKDGNGIPDFIEEKMPKIPDMLQSAKRNILAAQDAKASSSYSRPVHQFKKKPS